MDGIGLQSMGLVGGAQDRVQQDLMVGRVSRLASGADSAPEQAAQEMESLFATMLVSELRKGLGEGFFGSGAGADTFNGWFDEQIGASLASRSSLGLAEQVKEAIIREQEALEAQEAREAGGTEEAP